MKKNCEHCGVEFEAGNAKARFCSNKHRVYAARGLVWKPNVLKGERVVVPEAGVGSEKIASKGEGVPVVSAVKRRERFDRVVSEGAVRSENARMLDRLFKGRSAAVADLSEPQMRKKGRL